MGCRFNNKLHNLTQVVKIAIFPWLNTNKVFSFVVHFLFLSIAILMFSRSFPTLQNKNNNKKKHLMTFLFGENISLRLLRDLRENLEKIKIFTVLFKPHIKKKVMLHSLCFVKSFNEFRKPPTLLRCFCWFFLPTGTVMSVLNLLA